MADTFRILALASAVLAGLGRQIDPTSQSASTQGLAALLLALHPAAKNGRSWQPARTSHRHMPSSSGPQMKKKEGGFAEPPFEFTIRPMPKSSIALDVSVTKKTENEMHMKVLDEYSKTVNIPGFRPGKSPSSMVLKAAGTKNVKGKTIEKIVDLVLKSTGVEQKIPVIGEARLPEGMDKLVKRYKIGEAFNYTLEVDVMPEVPVDKSKYEGLNVTVEKEMFDQEAYDNALMTLRKRHMITTDLDEETPAELGHQLMVNMRGFYKDLNGDKGNPLPAIAKGDAIELKMIEGEFIPGMVESLVGIKEGETRDIDIKFPKRSNEQTNQLADQEAIFEVECLVVQSLELPEVNEEFANSIREGMSLKEVDDRLREGVMQQVEDKMEGRERYMLTEALVDTLPDDFEVPESLVAEVVKEQFAEMLSMEREKGKTDAQLKELVSQENYENFGKLMKPKSIRRVKGSLALQALLKNEGLTVSISEIDDELVNQKMQAQQKKEKFSESEMRPRVQETLEKYKALDYLKEKGTITYVDAEGELTEEEIMGETAEELAERLKKEGLAKKEKA